MATVADLGNVALVVGQRIRYDFTLQSNAPASVWIVSSGGAVVVPVTATGTPLTWPHEVVLTQGVGTYYLQGVSVGNADYSFRATGDPSDTADFAHGSVSVTSPPPSGPPTGEEIQIVLMSIAEPTVITIITVPPTGAGSG